MSPESDPKFFKKLIREISQINDVIVLASHYIPNKIQPKRIYRNKPKGRSNTFKIN